MKIPQPNPPKSISGLFGAVIASLCFVWLPMYMKNGYVDLIGGKFAMLQALTVVGVVGVLVLAALRKLTVSLSVLKEGILWLAALCAVYTVAAVFSQSQYSAVWGLYGRNNGLVTFVLCSLLFVVVKISRANLYYVQIQKVLAASGGLVAVLGWLNYWKIDPFGVYYSMPAVQGHMFLSTIGNINFFGGYLCLCTPIAIRLAMETKDKIWFCAAVAMGSALLCANSDGAWIGAMVCLLVLLCSRHTDSKTFGFLCLLGAASCGVWIANALWSMLFPVQGELRTVSALLGSLPISLILLFGLLFLWRYSQTHTLPVRKIGFSLLVTGLILAAVGLYLCNFTSVSLGALDTLFYIDQTWGSNRGYLWYILCLVYGRFDWVQKLFGAGADNVYSLLNPHYTQYIVALNGSTFDSAHNEFFQHLVCGGLFGLVCWVGFLTNRIRTAAKNYPEIALGILGYAVQSFFSISMPGVFPLVFVLAALVQKPKQKPLQAETSDLVWLAGLFVLFSLTAFVILPFAR